ncbi:MAG: hypothetical protein ABIB61_04500 [Candidatus Shapirobacteria bacterium]
MAGRLENPLIPDANPLRTPDHTAAADLFQNKIISGVIGIFLTVAIIFFFIQFLLAGISWIGSEGDETKVKAARDKVQNALIGLVIIFSVYALIKLIGFIFGISQLQGLGIPLIPLI